MVLSSPPLMTENVPVLLLESTGIATAVPVASASPSANPPAMNRPARRPVARARIVTSGPRGADRSPGHQRLAPPDAALASISSPADRVKAWTPRLAGAAACVLRAPHVRPAQEAPTDGASGSVGEGP